MGRAEGETGSAADLTEGQRQVLGVEDPEDREDALGRCQAMGFQRLVCQDSHLFTCPSFFVT
jgi:hypothetical protein